MGKAVKSMLCVKSIMTIIFSVMLCVMTYLYPDDYGDVFKNIAVMVATFYFSHQMEKGKSNGNSVDYSVASVSDRRISSPGERGAWDGETESKGEKET